MSWLGPDPLEPTNEPVEPVDLRGAIETTPYVCWGVAEDQLVLFNPDDRRLHVLNRTAATVWALADGSCDVEGLVQRTAAEFGEDAGAVRDDVIGVTERLVASELCRVVDGPKARWEPPSAPVWPGASPPDEDHASVIGPFVALNATAWIRVRDKQLRHELERVLSPLLVVPTATTPAQVVYEIDRDELGFNVTASGERLARGTTRPLVIRMIATDLNGKAILSAAEDVVLHAAGVEIDGRVAVFAGQSGAGKTTLAAQLLQRGHAYLTDEAIAISLEERAAHSFPKSLSIERGAQARLSSLEPPGESNARSESWDVDPRSIGDGRLSPGGPVAALVFPTYSAHTLSPRLRRLGAIETVHALIANAFDFSTLGQAGFALLVRLANTVPAFDFEHGGHAHLELIEELVRSTDEDERAA